MSDRIEPIRRGDQPRGVPAVAPIVRREHERRRDDEPRERRRREPQPAVTRDDDGTPHVDVRA